MTLTITDTEPTGPSRADEPLATVLTTGDLLRYLAEQQRHEWEEPEDGALVLVDEDTAFARADRVGIQPGQPGDWYRLDGTEAGYGPLSWGEVLGWDNPPSERSHHTAERLYTLTDVAQIVEGYARAVAAVEADA